MIFFMIVGIAEAEIGIIDTVAKILQGLIIAGSLFVLWSSKRFATIDR